VRIGPIAQAGEGRKVRLQGFRGLFSLSYSQTTAGRLSSGRSRGVVRDPSWPLRRPWRITCASARSRAWLDRPRSLLLPQILAPAPPAPGRPRCSASAGDFVTSWSCQACRASLSSATSGPRARHALSVRSAANRMLRSDRWASLSSARVTTACWGSASAAA
jgi:hypothetical protein